VRHAWYVARAARLTGHVTKQRTYVLNTSLRTITPPALVTEVVHVYPPREHLARLLLPTNSRTLPRMLRHLRWPSSNAPAHPCALHSAHVAWPSTPSFVHTKRSPATLSGQNWHPAPYACSVDLCCSQMHYPTLHVHAPPPADPMFPCTQPLPLSCRAYACTSCTPVQPCPLLLSCSMLVPCYCHQRGPCCCHRRHPWIAVSLPTRTAPMLWHLMATHCEIHIHLKTDYDNNCVTSN